MGKIIFGIIFLIGAISGKLVLRGTNSSGALAAVGIILIVWGVISLS